MFLNWASDPEVSKYLSWDFHKSENDTMKILIQWCNEYKNLNYFNWCITIDDKAIGSIGIISEIKEDKLAEIGYCLSRKYWNQGIMTEALCAIEEYLIKEIGYKILIGAHHILNPASGKVFIKSGFKRNKKLDNFKKYSTFDFKVAAYSFEN